MTIQSSGVIGLQDIQDEFGGSNPIGLDEYYSSDTGVPASGVIGLDDFYNTSSGVNMKVMVHTLNTTSVVLYTKSVTEAIVIDWGDGTSDTTSVGTTVIYTHVYPSLTTDYDVELYGRGLLKFGNKISNTEWKNVKVWGSNFTPTSCVTMFYNCRELVADATDSADFPTGNVKSFVQMFRSAREFNGDISGFDTSSATNMKQMFREAYKFNQDISSWDVSSNKNMNTMFFQARVFNQPLDSWDVSSVTDMGQLFNNAHVFNQPLNSWDTSSVVDMRWMFAYTLVFNQDISSWDVSSVTDVGFILFEAGAFNQDLSSMVFPLMTNGNASIVYSSNTLMVNAYMPYWGTVPTQYTV